MKERKRRRKRRREGFSRQISDKCVAENGRLRGRNNGNDSENDNDKNDPNCKLQQTWLKVERIVGDNVVIVCIS